MSKTIDIQAQDIFAGKRPVDDLSAWGYEPESNWGTLATPANSVIVLSEKGRYYDHYAALVVAVEQEGTHAGTVETGA